MSTIVVDLAKKTAQPFIVGEVSKTWINGESESPLILSELFEHVVNHNATRGYRLVQMTLSQVVYVIPEQWGQALTETIIAVFEYVPVAAPSGGA